MDLLYPAACTVLFCICPCLLSLWRTSGWGLQVDRNIPFQPWADPRLFKADGLWPATFLFLSRTGPPICRWQCYVIWLPGCRILYRTVSRGVPFNLRGLNSSSSFGSITLMSWAGAWETNAVGKPHDTTQTGLWDRECTVKKWKDRCTGQIEDTNP